MIRLSRKVLELEPSATMALNAKIKELRRQGVNVIDFGVGEPDFDTPEAIKEAGIEAIRDGFTKYTPAAGIPELREAIAAKLFRENGLDYKASQVMVSVGAKMALYLAILAVCDEGDEVIIPSPCWVSYPEQVKLAGGKPVLVDTAFENGFKLTPELFERYVTPRTRMVIINSPHNPTGSVYSKSELQALADIAVKHGIVVISDEVYEKLIYDGHEHVSIASLGPEIKELTIVVNAVSKTYSMTGWRLGYAAGPEPIVKAMVDLQGQIVSAPTSISQMAALQALNGDQSPVASMVAEFARRRDYIVERLSSIKGVEVRKPEGAFYVFPKVSAFFGKTINGKEIKSASDFAMALLEWAKVGVVPGEGFYEPNFVRISYSASMEAIREGMDMVEKLLSSVELNFNR